jgi:hypothetical protein
MNGHPVNQCASLDCAIYQYRDAFTVDLKIDFEAFQPHNSPVSAMSPGKKAESYGKPKKALK